MKVLVIFVVWIGAVLSIQGDEINIVRENHLTTSSIILLLPPESPLEGWKMNGKPTMYHPDNLWEYINGQAELYLGYGFVQLVTATYAHHSATTCTITLDIYDMGSKLNAFGIFNQLASSGLKSAKVGLDSYILSPALAFYKSHYFVSLNAGWMADNTEDMLVQFARLVDKRISDDGALPLEITLLPGEKQLPGTLRYIPNSLLGHKFLPRGIEALYNVETAKLKLFIAFYEKEQDAQTSFKEYKEYITSKNRTLKELELNKLPAFFAEEPYQGNILVVLYRKWLIGATQVESPDVARSLILLTLNNLQKLKDE